MQCNPQGIICKAWTNKCIGAVMGAKPILRKHLTYHWAVGGSSVLLSRKPFSSLYSVYLTDVYHTLKQYRSVQLISGELSMVHFHAVEDRVTERHVPTPDHPHSVQIHPWSISRKNLRQFQNYILKIQWEIHILTFSNTDRNAPKKI